MTEYIYKSVCLCANAAQWNMHTLCDCVKSFSLSLSLSKIESRIITINELAKWLCTRRGMRWQGAGTRRLKVKNAPICPTRERESKHLHTDCQRCDWCGITIRTAVNQIDVKSKRRCERQAKSEWKRWSKWEKKRQRKRAATAQQIRWGRKKAYAEVRTHDTAKVNRWNANNRHDINTMAADDGARVIKIKSVLDEFASNGAKEKGRPTTMKKERKKKKREEKNKKRKKDRTRNKIYEVENDEKIWLAQHLFILLHEFFSLSRFLFFHSCGAHLVIHQLCAIPFRSTDTK